MTAYTQDPGDVIARALVHLIGGPFAAVTDEDEADARTILRALSTAGFQITQETAPKGAQVSVTGQAPAYAHPGDAAADLRASQAVTIFSGQHCLVPTGVRLALPPGMVGLVTSRSGLAQRNGVFVLNSPGVIDSGFRGEVGVILANYGSSPFRIEVGDRIAQLMVQRVERVEFLEVETLDETARGVGGFGSTGVGG